MQGWKLLGACRDRDTDLWFPEQNSNYRDRRVKTALDICAACPVRAECMDFAIRTNQVGIWGGTTERERKRIKNRYIRKQSSKNLAYHPVLG